MQGSLLLIASALLAALAVAEPVWERPGLLPQAAQAERRFSAARWLWRNEFPTAPGSECLFRRAFDLPAAAKSAKLALRADDFGTVYLNGREIRVNQFAANLRNGRNVLAVKVKNGANVAGLLFAADIVCENGEKVRVVSDAATKVAAIAADGWERPGFDDSSWVPASDQGDVTQIPWSDRFDYTVDYATDAERTAIAAERRCIPSLPETLSAEADPNARVVMEGHRAKISLNGRVFEPDINLFNVGGFGNRFAKDCLLKTYAMGWRFFELPVNPSDYEFGKGVYDFTCLEKSVSELLLLAPEAYVSLSVNFDLPKWCAEHPDETIRYADPQKDIRNAGDEFNGVPVRPSAASRPYRAEVEKIIRLLGERIAAGPWGRRVASVRTDWGVYTEWHTFGMKHAPDVSRPMVESFGRNPPPVAVRRRERRILDEKEDAELIAWNFHQQNEVADALIAFTSAVKKYIPGRLAGAYYGYIWDIFWPEGSNCLLGKVLDAPSVDFLSAPSPYFGSVRFGGGSYHSRSIPDAFRRRGKLFMCEDDSRHYHTKGWAFERHLVATPGLSAAVMKRNYLNKIFDGGGIQFCDPFYGVGLRMSTFDDPVVLRALKEAMDATAKAGDVPRGLFADVLVVVSERERLMRDSHVEEPGRPDMHWRNLYSYLPDHLYRSGFSVEFIRLEDYLTDRTKPKAVVLLNLYHLSAAERTKLSDRVAGTKVVDCAKETVPATAADWRTRLEREGLVPAAPLDTYFRRQGDLVMFHADKVGTSTVRTGVVGATGYVELFSGCRFAGGETIEVETKGPTTLLFRAMRTDGDVPSSELTVFERKR